ncbi:hypothetical protein [Paraburkholderia youngii]|uniref:hypothetical protein n=1 Tax=Paraburkholderia youngii TaxID=2782701 RepID=UPI003D1D0F68
MSTQATNGWTIAENGSRAHGLWGFVDMAADGTWSHTNPGGEVNHGFPDANEACSYGEHVWRGWEPDGENRWRNRATGSSLVRQHGGWQTSSWGMPGESHISGDYTRAGWAIMASRYRWRVSRLYRIARFCESVAFFVVLIALLMLARDLTPYLGAALLVLLFERFLGVEPTPWGARFTLSGLWYDNACWRVVLCMGAWFFGAMLLPNLHASPEAKVLYCAQALVGTAFMVGMRVACIGAVAMNASSALTRGLRPVPLPPEEAIAE